jgi:uncharacterized protein (DUF2336 family)
MQEPSLTSLEGIAELGLRGRVDMRPTLLRVLTDLYVQKLTHTPDEERHYTELALRLLESVDVSARASVAARLSHHLSPPPRIIQLLAGDLPEVVAALKSKPKPRPAAAKATAVVNPTADVAPNQINREHEPENEERADVAHSIDSDVATELNELFFAASAPERRLIMLNLNIVVSPPAGSRIAPDAAGGRRLEAAALARKREDFVQQLARLLAISREQAQRIAGDRSGESIVVAAKALNIPREVLYRILLFVNTSVGHSVERVHALAELYDEMSAQAAEHFVAIWQALYQGGRAAATHQPLLATDKTIVRAPVTMQRTPAVPRRSEKRDAS